MAFAMNDVTFRIWKHHQISPKNALNVGSSIDILINSNKKKPFNGYSVPIGISRSPKLTSPFGCFQFSKQINQLSAIAVSYVTTFDSIFHDAYLIGGIVCSFILLSLLNVYDRRRDCMNKQ